MKVLDPFAGYRLASGHPIFHFSLFIGSWVPPYYLDKPELLPPYLLDCFRMLRWAHCILFTLAIFSFYAKIESDIKVVDLDGDGKLSADEVKQAEVERRHRDGVWKLFNRFADTISVFMYQGAVFYVQLNVYNMNSKDIGERLVLRDPENSYMVWLYIEIYCFYLYMVSTGCYIMYHQIFVGYCFKKPEEKSDMNKAICDFIEYAYSNLIWFAFNFVLVTMPAIAAWKVNPDENTKLERTDGDIHYGYILIAVASINFIQFLLRPAIYKDCVRESVCQVDEQEKDKVD